MANPVVQIPGKGSSIYLSKDGSSFERLPGWITVAGQGGGRGSVTIETVDESTNEPGAKTPQVFNINFNKLAPSHPALRMADDASDAEGNTPNLLYVFFRSPPPKLLADTVTGRTAQLLLDNRKPTLAPTSPGTAGYYDWTQLGANTALEITGDTANTVREVSQVDGPTDITLATAPAAAVAAGTYKVYRLGHQWGPASGMACSVTLATKESFNIDGNPGAVVTGTLTVALKQPMPHPVPMISFPAVA